MYKCQNCGTEYDSKFCPDCGTPRPLENCPHCGSALNGSTKFCPECGEALTGTTTAPKPKFVANGDTVYKIYDLLKYVPFVLFALFAVLTFAFYVGPIAVMPKVLDGDSYGNVYSMKSGILGEFPELTGEMYILIILTVISLLVAGAVLALFLIKRKTYKPFYTACAFCFLLYLIIAIIVIAKISKYEDSGLVLCGVCPKLLLGFTIAFGAVSACAVAARTLLRKNFADIAARDEAVLNAELERQAEFFEKHDPPEEPTLAEEVTRTDVRANKRLIIIYKHYLRRYYAAKEGKPSKAVLWLDLHKIPMIILAVVIVVAITLVCILVPIFTNKFRIDSVKKIDMGNTQAQVRAVLGDPYQSSKQNDTWYYVDEDFANANDRLKRYVQKQETAMMAGDFYITFELDAKIQQVKEQLNGMTCKYIEVKFEKVDDEYTVSSVFFDPTYSGKPLEKSTKTVDVNKNNIVDYYVDWTASRNESNFFDLTYSTEFTDGSYIHAKITQAKTTLTEDVAKIEWHDAFSEYSKIVMARKVGEVSSNGEWKTTNKDIEKITLPNSVTSIGSNAFYKCNNLTSIEIPNSVTNIGSNAFSGCNGLTSITIPNSVTSIESDAFADCGNLASITVQEENLRYHSAGNCLIETQNKKLIAGCKNSEISTDGSVTSIGSVAFDGCNGLTSITIPNGVMSIGSATFRNCSSLTSIVIPNSVTSIGSGAFGGCSSLTNIVIPSGVTSIESSVFNNCSSLTSATIPDSVTSIRGSAFRGCSNLTSIVIPNSVTSIGESSFRNCSSLSNIEIPNGVTSIGEYAFYDCSGLTSIEIPNSVTSIGEYAFRGCSSLTSIEIPNSVRSIGSYAFRDCSSLTSIEIPSSVTFIGAEAFEFCRSLTSITIPNSVTRIGSDAFSGCSRLTIYCEAESKPSGWGDDWNSSDCPVVWDYKNK